MPDRIFERYKEALKAGHVAVLRGRLEEALAQYQLAAEIADERALPHASAGGVLLRLGRVDDALDAYARALGRAPRDEGALSGRAEALLAAGREREAAETLERLADVLASTDRKPEALIALRRALGYGETKRRRRTHAALAQELGVPLESGPVTIHAPVDPEASGGDAVETSQEPATAPAAPAEAEPAPSALPPPNPAPHVSAAESALVGGDRRGAAVELIAAADAYAALDLIDAALDAALQALRAAPDAPEVHLGLARLYFRRGWRERGVETLLLLDRFLAIDGDPGSRAQLAETARRLGGADPRLATLLAAHAPAAAPDDQPTA